MSIFVVLIGEHLHVLAANFAQLNHIARTHPFNSWHAGIFSPDFCLLMIFFQINIQEYHQSVKQFGSRSGLTFCQA